jgi:hypothetical protein
MIIDLFSFVLIQKQQKRDPRLINKLCNFANNNK